MNSRKIKVIFFHPYSRVGGADLSLSTLMNNLDPKKYSIDFICIRRDQKVNKLKKNINIFEINTKKTVFSIFKIRKIIKKNFNKNFKKIILFSNQNFANIISYFITINFRKSLKIIAFERNHINELHYYFGIGDLIKKSIIKLMMKILYRKFNVIACNSKEASKDLTKFLNLKVLNIYNPISLDVKRSKKINNNKNNFQILNIGRLEKQKDQVTLIKAINELSNKINVKLNIVGYGSEFYNLKKYISKLNLNNNVKIFTKIQNPWIYFKKIDLFILSSIYEGFPNVLVEAILQNIPVISSNCKSGPKEIFGSKGGPNLFDVGNHKDLSKKIYNHLINQNILIHKNKLYKKKLFKFDKEKIINQYDNLFNKI